MCVHSLFFKNSSSIRDSAGGGVGRGVSFNEFAAEIKANSISRGSISDFIAFGDFFLKKN